VGAGTGLDVQELRTATAQIGPQWEDDGQAGARTPTVHRGPSTRVAHTDSLLRLNTEVSSQLLGLQWPISTAESFV
jgi:hypothetical protein